MFMYIVTIISFLLDLFLSNIIPIINSSNIPLIPMFTIISLVIMYPYFIHNKRSFIIYCMIIGFIYDIVVTNTLLVNMIVFAFIGFIILLLDNNLSNNLSSIIVKSLIIIVIYDIIIYFILILVGYINFNILNLLFKILKSLLLNLIYIIITYNITEKIAKKLRIKKLI